MTQLIERPVGSTHTDPLDVRLHAPVPDVVVVRVAGALDGMSAPLLAERVEQQFGRAGHVVVDLGGVTFLGACGLRVLRALSRRASQAGVRVYLAADHRAVCRPLHLAGLDQLMVLSPSADLVLGRLICGRTTAPRGRARGKSLRPTQLELLISDAIRDSALSDHSTHPAPTSHNVGLA